MSPTDRTVLRTASTVLPIHAWVVLRISLTEMEPAPANLAPVVTPTPSVAVPMTARLSAVKETLPP